MSDQKEKPVLDEQTFAKLLEAAFVLQQHNRKMRQLEESLQSQSEQFREQELANETLVEASESQSDESARENVDYTLTLAAIVEAQHHIQIRHLELDKALAVVAERLARITNASGAGIGILEETTVHYRAGAGTPALPVGTRVPLQTAVCQASIRTGQVIRTEDLDTEFLFDPEPCRQRGIRSLLAVPIYYDGDIAGALELYFPRIRGFAEEDIHTCQLMAGLVTEALGRDAGQPSSDSIAAERSTMLAAIERLQSNLTAAAGEPSSAEGPATSVGTRASAAPVVTSACWKCGGKVLAEELFCGTCGAPLAGASDPSTLQSKLASAWHIQQANEKNFETAPANGNSLHTSNAKRASSSHLQEIQAKPSRLFTPDEHEVALTEPLLPESELEEHNLEGSSNALVKSRQDLAWTSAAKAQDFLESISVMGTPGALARFWRSRRGDFYLAIAVILVVVVMGWGVWSSHSVGADGGNVASRNVNRGKQPASDAELSAFDKLLIFVGLAAPPEAPEYKGNPDIQVWVDLNTALYYCPGSDLYQKTAKGKLASQRNAQLDQFEPASRRPCD